MIGGTDAWEWTTGKAFTLEDQPLDVTADLPSVRSLTEGVIHADVTPQVGGTVATIFSASVTTAPDKDVILSLLNGKPYFEVRVGGAGQLVRIESPTALTVGQRYQLAAVVDASGAKLYVDGRLVGQATSKGLFGTVTGLDSMTIGGNRQSRPDTWMFTGTIHSVGVRGPVTPKPSLEVRPVLDAIYSAGDDGLFGDGIQPWVEVYNTGNVALTNVKLTAGQGTANCTAATLAPGANVVCKNNAIPRHTIITADMLAALPLVEGRSPCRRRLPAGGHCGKVPQDFFAHLFYFDPISGKLSTWNSNEARADERSPPPSSMLSSISSATPLPMIRSHQETSWR